MTVCVWPAWFGPAAYQYWKDLWENPKPLPKAKRRKTLPVYLEPEEQQALLDAAVGVGVPPELVQGDTMVRQVGFGLTVQGLGFRVARPRGQGSLLRQAAVKAIETRTGWCGGWLIMHTSRLCVRLPWHSGEQKADIK